MRRQEAGVLEPRAGKPSASWAVAVSPPVPLGLHVLGPVLLSGPPLHRPRRPTVSAYSGLFCSSIVLACKWLSHSDPVSTLPLTALLTVNWLNGPIPNSQERNVIDQLLSGAPCLAQSAMWRVCHVSPEAWAEKGLHSSTVLMGWGT